MKKEVIQKAGAKLNNPLNVPIFAPNTVLGNNKDIFYLSYNNRDLATYGSDTTAIVLCEHSHNEVFIVLKGKHINSLKDFDLKASLLYVIDNYNLIHPFGDEGLPFLYKCVENIDKGVSLFTDNEDKFTMLMNKIR